VTTLPHAEAPPEEYVEPPEIFARDRWVGVRLWTASVAFFFLTFVFAFFYLRSLNSNSQWRPHGIDPPTGWGVAILVCIVASVVLFWLAVRLGEPRWKLLATLSLVLALAGVVIQCIEWGAMSWGPTNGGYASVFIGWTGFYLLLLLGGIYWLETLVAESYRERGGEGAEARAFVLNSNAEALNVFWVFLGVVQVAAFIILYLIA
jgi:heme/copper-type cytochrome/quinol oxidase subunit 3